MKTLKFEGTKKPSIPLGNGSPHLGEDFSLTVGYTRRIQGIQDSRIQVKNRFVFSLDPLTTRILEPKNSALAKGV